VVSSGDIGDDRMTCYLDNIVNDCFLIVYIFGRQYEQSSLSCQKNMPPWKLKEEIAKRWFPWMENIQQHGWKADELDPRWFAWKWVKEWLQRRNFQMDG